MPFDKPVLLDVKPNSVKLSWMPAPTAMLPENAQRITYTIEARELPSKNWVRYKPFLIIFVTTIKEIYVLDEVELISIYYLENRTSNSYGNVLFNN